MQRIHIFGLFLFFAFSCLIFLFQHIFFFTIDIHCSFIFVVTLQILLNVNDVLWRLPSCAVIGLDFKTVVVWVWFNLRVHGIEGRTHLLRAPTRTHFDFGGQLTARTGGRKKNQDHFCCFLVFIKLSICLFLFKGAMCKDFHKGPWCVLKENRGIVLLDSHTVALAANKSKTSSNTKQIFLSHIFLSNHLFLNFM